MLAGLLLLAGRLYRLQIIRGDEYAAEVGGQLRQGDPRPRRPGHDQGPPRRDAGRQPAVVRRLHHPGVLPAVRRTRCSRGWPAGSTGTRSSCSTWSSWSRPRKRSAALPAGAGAGRPQPGRAGHAQRAPDRAARRRLAAGAAPQLPHRARCCPHVLGYMNEVTQEELDRLNAQGDGAYALGDYIGRRGVERYFERTLRGKDGEAQGGGQRARARRCHGAERAHHRRRRRSRRTPGNNLVLSHRRAAAGRGREGLSRDRRRGGGDGRPHRLHPRDGVPARRSTRTC